MGELVITWKFCGEMHAWLRGGRSGLGLCGVAVLDLNWCRRGRLVAGARSGLSLVGLVVVWLVDFFCSAFFGVRISVGPHVCFVLGLVLISVFLGWCAYGLRIFRAGCATGYLRAGAELGAGVGRPGLVCPPPPPVVSLLAVPRRQFCFVSSN